MVIGERIRKLRTFKDMSQENMAEALGMSQTGYAKIERNEVDINVTKLERIAEVLGINISDLFDDDKYSVNYFNSTFEDQAIAINQFPIELKKSYEAQIEAMKEVIKLQNELLKR